MENIIFIVIKVSIRKEDFDNFWATAIWWHSTSRISKAGDTVLVE